MQRRLNIAAGLVHKPELLILDEPTVGVDPQSRNHIFETVRTLRASGMTVIYTSHYMEEVEALCDRVAIMDAGEIVALGTIAELVAKYAGKGVELEIVGDVEAAATAARAHTARSTREGTTCLRVEPTARARAGDRRDRSDRRVDRADRIAPGQPRDRVPRAHRPRAARRRVIGASILKEIWLLLRDRGRLISLFALPVAFMVVFGSMFKFGPDKGEPRAIGIWHAADDARGVAIENTLNDTPGLRREGLSDAGRVARRGRARDARRRPDHPDRLRSDARQADRALDR